MHIWDAITGEIIHDITGHRGNVSAVAWSPDGTHLVTGGDDGETRIWNTSGHMTGIRIALLPQGETAVFDAESNRLLGCHDGAWRWLGWNTVLAGQLTRIPAESFGALPPLKRRNESSNP